MRTIRTALLTTAIVLPALAGAAAAEQTKIDFWVSWSPGNPDAVAGEQAIAAFEEAHPDIDIVPQVISYDALHDKLVTAIARWGRPRPVLGLDRVVR